MDGVLPGDEVIVPSITFIDRHGETIARYGGLQGESVAVFDLQPHTVHAILAVEDRKFYRHFGVDPLGIARAMVVNLINGRTVQGGSTLTQQLAKNLFLSNERSLKRKIQELLLALWLEKKFTKDVKKGDVASSLNIRVVRPANGLHPNYYKDIIGKRFNFSKKKGTPLKLSDIGLLKKQ